MTSVNASKLRSLDTSIPTGNSSGTPPEHSHAAHAHRQHRPYASVSHSSTSSDSRLYTTNDTSHNERGSVDSTRPIPISTHSRRSSGFEVVSRPRKPSANSHERHASSGSYPHSLSPMSPPHNSSALSPSSPSQALPHGLQALSTLDNEQLTLVDLSRLTSPAGIRERLLTRLNISSEHFSYVYVCSSRLGANDDNDRPIDDAELWRLCCEADPAKPPNLFRIRFSSSKSPQHTHNNRGGYSVSSNGSKRSSPNASPLPSPLSPSFTSPNDATPSARSSRSDLEDHAKNIQQVYYQPDDPYSHISLTYGTSSHTARNHSSASSSSGSLNHPPSPSAAQGEPQIASPRTSYDEGRSPVTSTQRLARPRWDGWNEHEMQTAHASRSAAVNTTPKYPNKSAYFEDGQERVSPTSASFPSTSRPESPVSHNPSSSRTPHNYSSLPSPGASGPPYGDRRPEYGPPRRPAPPPPHQQPSSQPTTSISPPYSYRPHPQDAQNQLNVPALYPRGVRAATSLDDLGRPPLEHVQQHPHNHSHPSQSYGPQMVPASSRGPVYRPQPPPGHPQRRPYPTPPPQRPDSSYAPNPPVRYANSPSYPYPPRHYVGPPPPHGRPSPGPPPYPQHRPPPGPPRMYHGPTPPPGSRGRAQGMPIGRAVSSYEPPVRSALNPRVDYTVSHNRVRLHPGETLQNALSSKSHSHPVPAPAPAPAPAPVPAPATMSPMSRPTGSPQPNAPPGAPRQKQMEFAKQDLGKDRREGLPFGGFWPTSGPFEEDEKQGQNRRPSASAPKRDIPDALRPGRVRSPSHSTSDANNPSPVPQPAHVQATVSKEKPSHSNRSSETSDSLNPISESENSTAVVSEGDPSASSRWQEQDFEDDDDLEAATWAVPPKRLSLGKGQVVPAPEVVTDPARSEENLTDASEGESNTVRAQDWARMVANFDEESQGEKTLVPPVAATRDSLPQVSISTSGSQGAASSYSFTVEDDDDDDEDVSTWVKPMQPSLMEDSSASVSGVTRPRKPTLTRLQMPTSSEDTDNPTKTPVGSSPRSRRPSDYSSPNSSGDQNQHLRPTPVTTNNSSSSKSPIARRGSFARHEHQWAFRPPVEQVYENLEEFFPNHDLDRTMIDAIPQVPAASPATPFKADNSGDSAEVVNQPQGAAIQGANMKRHKKSIRIVAQDRKRLLQRGERRNDASSRNVRSVTPSGGSAPSGALVRRKSTKMWGAKVEEVTPQKAHQFSSIPESPANDDPENFSFKWVKGERIGKGSFGEVYLALNATTGDMLAVKQVVVPRGTDDCDDERQTSVVAALKSEVETLKDLDHPRIVQYLGFEETSDHLSVFLEYVAGGSVGRCLRKHGKFEANLVAFFTEQVLDGLSYLHRFGILHRDMKCDNLLVDMNGAIKISDFGISKRTGASGGIYDVDANMSMQGSIFWMAPEMVHNSKKGYSAKVDIWSLGCVCIEMFAGRRPWDNEQAVAAMFKLGAERLAPPIPSDVELSSNASNFLSDCFIVDPASRPTADDLLKHPFLKFDPNWEFQNSMLAKSIRFGKK